MTGTIIAESRCSMTTHKNKIVSLKTEGDKHRKLGPASGEHLTLGTWQWAESQRRGNGRWGERSAGSGPAGGWVLFIIRNNNKATKKRNSLLLSQRADISRQCRHGVTVYPGWDRRLPRPAPGLPGSDCSGRGQGGFQRAGPWSCGPRRSFSSRKRGRTFREGFPHR